MESSWRVDFAWGALLLLLLVSSLLQLAQGNNNTSGNDSGPFQSDMIQGLAIGFGALVGGIVLLCLVWCLCCGNGSGKEQPKPDLRPIRGRVAPSPTQRPGAITRSNIRASS